MKRALTILRLLALRPVLGQCLLAGVMFALAFPCHPDHVLAPLFHPVWGWVALIPLLLATHAAPTSASAFRRGWFAGWVGFLLCLYWVGYTAGGGPAVIAGAGLGALYLALFTGLFAVAHHRLAVHFGHRALVAVPVLWTAMEYLMSLGEMGFPWLLMGHSQANQPVLIQLASLTGAYGVSFAIVAVNTCLCAAVLIRQRRTAWIAAALAILGVLAGTGWWQLRGAPTPQPDLSVALIQNNLGRAKWRAGGLQAAFTSLDSLSRQALGQGGVGLLVWPETAIPCDLRRRQSCRDHIRSLADEYGVPILTGGSDRDDVSGDPMNGVYFVQPGTPDLLTYAKMHLVPFGERTPYLDSLPLLRGIDWTALTGDLAPAQFAAGRERTMFPIQTTNGQQRLVGPLVCFESVFPDLVRRHVVDGADVLVIITNDSWFGASSGPFQHAQIAAMRAVENRRPIARCATNGVSLFVDAYGRSRGHTTFGSAAVRVGSIALSAEGPTFYTRFGDWFAQACLLLTAVSLLLTWRRLSPISHHRASDPTSMTDDTPTPETSTDEPTTAPTETESSRRIGDGGAAPEMPFLDHLEELRWRLLKGIGALLVGAVICFAYTDPILQLLTEPYEEAVISLQEQNSPGPAEAIRYWVAELRLRFAETPEIAVADTAISGVPEEALQAPIKEGIPYRRQLQSLRVMTWFIVSLQVALLGGLILASPIVFYQLWRFIAPGLLSRERRLILPIISLSVFCFLLGAAMAHKIVLPLGLRFFLSLEPTDMTSQWAVDEYIGFVLRLLLGFGIVFEMPVVSLFLSRLGLLTPDYLRRIRRYAVVGIFLLAAVFTPPDPISQLLMALPLLVLYEISIGISHLAQRKPVSFDDDDDDDDGGDGDGDGGGGGGGDDETPYERPDKTTRTPDTLSD
ncbi:MAG: apolipoprotein N-acyltransferase [Gemmatimonadetes bacterium]|nr:apolipoprotein N-acyltransferase [Gemmatimonadota bacterium]MBT6147268.1 apolipoprotein N-acyltransferase [Gemmatimonadota bacterium]MBT7859119.1 apolipoprotein N-acyltransferase [Gemmatimonadota bacterium]